MWDFGDGNISNTQNPTHFYEEEGQYMVCLKIKDENGCESEICKIINIYDNTNSYIPNIFTVNNDGINEVFLPIVYGIKEDTYELSIYNRWGNRLFLTNSHKEGWDGTYNGQMVSQDVYSYRIYYITISGDEKVHIGKVALVK